MRRTIHYPESLLEALHLNEVCRLKPGLDYRRLTIDQKNGLAFLLESFLTERERMVMTDRYVNCMSMKKIAEKYSLTENRVRGIIRQALLNLNNRGMLLYVVQGYAVRKKFMHEHLVWMEQRYRYWIEDRDGLYLYGQDIVSLGLPVRVLHALQRYDICRVRELVILSQYSDGIRGMRHLGETSEEQIENALRKGGLLPKHYEKICEKQSCINMDRELAAFENLNLWYLRESERTDTKLADVETSSADNDGVDGEGEEAGDDGKDGDEDDGNGNS